MKYALFLLRRAATYDRGYLPRVAALAVLAGLVPLLGVVFPKLIFDELLGLQRLSWLMLWVALLAGGGWAFAMAKAWLNKGREAGSERTFMGLQQELYSKADRLSLEVSERKSTLDLVERSEYGQYALYELLQILEPLGGAMLSLILSLSILISGDGWLLARLSVHDPVIPVNFESRTAGGTLDAARLLLGFAEKYDGLDCTALAQYCC